MKLPYIFLILLFIMGLASCNNQSKYSTFIAMPKASESFTGAYWHISSFSTKGLPRNYPPFHFKFNVDNSVTASCGNKTYLGNWYVMGEYGTDDAPPADTGFTVIFNNEKNLAAISGPWLIEKRSASKLQLYRIRKDICDIVVFSKDVK